MSLGDIFSDAIRYPLSDIARWIIAGLLVLFASLPNVFAAFGIESGAVLVLAKIISLVFAILLAGYGVSVIKKGIEHSNEIPMIDIMQNLIDGIKVLIIGIVYMIIPIILTTLILLVFGLLGAGLDHVISGLGIGFILVFIIFILFLIFEVVALARFANTGDLGDALNIGAVFEDAKKVGIVNIILFLIIVFIICLVLGIVSGILQYIPYIGVIIASILVGGFIVLFYHKAIGLLYAGA